MLLPESQRKFSFGFSTITAIITLFLIYYKHSTDDLKVTCQKSRLFAPEQFEECFDEIIQESLKGNQASLIPKWISKFTSPMYDKLIIVIDNLDRCTAQQAQDMLTTIKSFLGKHPKVVFIIPLAVNSLKHHLVKSSCGEENETEANEYLRKFFNVSLWIKPFQNDEMYDFTKHLNDEYQLGLSKASISNISREYATNPRRIIQLLNNLIVEFSLYDKEFVNANEAAICVLAIIREEFSSFFDRLVVNPCLLFDDIHPNEADKNPRLELFLMRTKATMMPYKDTIGVIDKIISNSVVFNSLPVEISESIEMMEVEKITEYVGEDESKKEMVLDCIKDKIGKVVSRGLTDSELPNLLAVLIKLDDATTYIDNTYLKAIIDLFDNSVSWNKQIDFLEKDLMHELIQFSCKLRENGYRVILERLILYYSEKCAKDKTITEKVADDISFLISKAENADYGEDLKVLFDKVFAAYPNATLKYQYMAPEKLYDSQLIDNVVGRLTYEELCEKNGVQEILFGIGERLPGKSGYVFHRYLDKVVDFTPSYSINPSNEEVIEKILNRVNDYLSRMPNHCIGDGTGIKGLLARIGNSVKETNYYGPDKHHTIFEDNAENGEFMGTMLKLLKSSANAAGQILLSKDIVGKLIDFDKTQEQTMQEFGKLIDFKIKIYDYAEELMRYPSFDEFYTPVLKHLLQTDENGKLRISNDLVKNEIKNLLNLLIKDPDDSLASLAIELSTAPVLQAMFGEILSTKPSSELIKLPTSLLKIVCAKFEKEIDSFENNLNVLELIAKEGSKSGLKKLVKLITKKLVTNGKESEAVSLIKQLHYCNKANSNSLKSVLETVSDDVISKEDKAACINHLNEIIAE
ncbi:hypothetical protein F7D97_11410 [Prevotella copri]|uniref:KAP NTPase domain-containing protein n=2 Tax=Segatella copri TaxID=165179 RepID=A0A6A7VYW4_9BACT|nr:P-loop NTPase fold protein [Segatella copri]MQM58714.1 hypothetical protein [Segatella copri]MQN08191.1 hypothetical protein [Segatella copri]MQN10508.1 hypothetical protein [Segatella copri]MQO61519.1 hypothetical protein [Segatella copri]MQO62881.1 hypothetical protein [Segatella copri]